jgi:hypothetical protein
MQRLASDPRAVAFGSFLAAAFFVVAGLSLILAGAWLATLRLPGWLIAPQLVACMGSITMGGLALIAVAYDTAMRHAERKSARLIQEHRERGFPIP